MNEKLLEGLRIMQDWCSLHQSVEIIYVVDGYEIWFLSLDGQRIDRQVRGETVEDAIRSILV